ncbi:glucans biosynthesis protein [Kordia sp. SMS9]|uniref:acyltransferase family protein n=1 Tax=Kordia sp. SMS9 TaxID=2282170 RepID=UPI000E0D1EA8|nr:acyltransferase family protein [Kordia sp. SMS9]AXG71303.1 glucans biosynthesis protein [Kordia sp. SMS9]
MTPKIRRYDLDWLRVIAILAVYFHHIGMPFNGDDFHIMNKDSSKLLDDIMVFFEQFRLPLLFLISGTGTIFAFSKRTWIQFVKERSVRLIIPLVFGVLFIVPLQTFFEHRETYTSYWELYTNADFGINHLWFIGNLFWMSMCTIPLILFLKSSKSNTFLKLFERFTAKRFGLFGLVIPLSLLFILLKQYYPSYDKDLFNFSSTFFYGFFFVLGMLFASAESTWLHLKQYRKLNFLLFIFSSLIFYAYYFVPGEWLAPYLTNTQGWMLWYLVCCLVGWSFVITLLGYGQVWLNKKSQLVQKLNEAIYPFYILHQTVIVVFAYYIVQFDMSIGLKLLLLLITTFPVIVLIYRYLVYPFTLTRIVFGMKKK